MPPRSRRGSPADHLRSAALVHVDALGWVHLRDAVASGTKPPFALLRPGARTCAIDTARPADRVRPQDPVGYQRINGRARAAAVGLRALPRMARREGAARACRPDPLPDQTARSSRLWTAE